MEYKRIRLILFRLLGSHLASDQVLKCMHTPPLPSPYKECYKVVLRDTLLARIAFLKKIGVVSSFTLRREIRILVGGVFNTNDGIRYVRK